MNSESEAHPTYDRGGLDGVCNGNEALRRRILLEYSRTAAAQVAQLLERLESGECEEAKHIAHTLKGSSRTVGAVVLGEMCEQIENGVAGADSRRLAIQEEFERVRLAVQSHLESMP